MSFLRHEEIYPSDGGLEQLDQAPAHRLDEFPAGYSLASCSPARARLRFASQAYCATIINVRR